MPQAEAGDQVVVLWGLHCPVVLRPRDNERYTFVGDAYIGGIMNGEPMDIGSGEEVFNLV